MWGVSTACAKRGSGASSRETECPAWRNVSHWPLLLPQESVQSLEWQHASPFHDRSAMRVRFHLVIDKIDSRIAFKGASEMAKPMQSSENCMGLWRLIKTDLIERMIQLYWCYGGSQTAYD